MFFPSSSKWWLADTKHDLRQPLPGQDRIFQGVPGVSQSGQIGNLPELERAPEVHQVAGAHGLAVIDLEGEPTFDYMQHIRFNEKLFVAS